MPVGNRYVLHGINAFEEGDRLTVDVVELDRPVYDQYELADLFADVGPGRPVRFVIDLAAGALLETAARSPTTAPRTSRRSIPRLAGRPYEDLWMLGISKRRPARDGSSSTRSSTPPGRTRTASRSGRRRRAATWAASPPSRPIPRARAER